MVLVAEAHHGLVPPTPNIAFRFGGEDLNADKCGMATLMRELEETFVLVHKVAALLVSAPKLPKWLAEVDIGIMSMLYQVRKSYKSFSERNVIQEEFTTSVAELVVGKLQAVSPVAKRLKVLHEKPHNPIMGRINALLEQGLAAAPALPAVAGLAEGEKSKLQPRALTLDGDGRVVSAHEEHLKRNPEVELISWKSWLRYRQDDNFSKALAAFQEAMLNEQDRAMELPLAILRQGTQVLVQTTKNIGRGELLVPLHFFRSTSVLNAAEARRSSTSMRCRALLPGQCLRWSGRREWR